jgi:hypothetical protein
MPLSRRLLLHEALERLDGGLQPFTTTTSPLALSNAITSCASCAKHARAYSTEDSFSRKIGRADSSIGPADEPFIPLDEPFIPPSHRSLPPMNRSSRRAIDRSRR